MSSNPNDKTAESSVQLPQPHYVFVQPGTPSPPGGYVYGQPQQGVYMQQGATCPQVMAVTNTTPPPNSFLAWSIVSLIFFCLPLGMAALVFSLGVKPDFALGLHAEAKRKSTVARSLNIAATVLGIAVYIVVGAWIGVTVNTYREAYRSAYANARYYGAN